MRFILERALCTDDFSRRRIGEARFARCGAEGAAMELPAEPRKACYEKRSPL